MHFGEVKAGEVWKIRHSRKGDLTVRLLKDADIQQDGGSEWFRAEIVEGRAKFMSNGYRAAQDVYGLGTPGSEMTMRSSLTAFLERVAS